jgi:hypothetical protein
VLCNKAWAPHQKLLSPASRAPHGHEVNYVKISSFVDYVEILKCLLQFLFMLIRTIYTAMKIITMTCIVRWRNTNCTVVLTDELKLLFYVKHKKNGANSFVTSNREYILFLFSFAMRTTYVKFQNKIWYTGICLVLLVLLIMIYRNTVTY